MSDETEKMTYEEIIKWQEQLEQHEEEAGGGFRWPSNDRRGKNAAN